MLRERLPEQGRRWPWSGPLLLSLLGVIQACFVRAGGPAMGPNGGRRPLRVLRERLPVQGRRWPWSGPLLLSLLGVIQACFVRAGVAVPQLKRMLPFASMRPRRVGRGNPRSGLGFPLPAKSFNEAAPRWARKQPKPRRRKTNGFFGFNEAAPRWARKRPIAQFKFVHHYPASMRPRRVGRGNWILGTSATSAATASMRPRRVGRGNQ